MIKMMIYTYDDEDDDVEGGDYEVFVCVLTQLFTSVLIQPLAFSWYRETQNKLSMSYFECSVK